MRLLDLFWECSRNGFQQHYHQYLQQSCQTDASKRTTERIRYGIRTEYNECQYNNNNNNNECNNNNNSNKYSSNDCFPRFSASVLFMLFDLYTFVFGKCRSQCSHQKSIDNLQSHRYAAAQSSTANSIAAVINWQLYKKIALSFDNQRVLFQFLLLLFDNIDDNHQCCCHSSSSYSSSSFYYF